MTEIHPVTAERWDDLVGLFGESGAYSGCWCMWFRETSREFSERGNAGNRRALQDLVHQGRVPGLLAYREGRPVGWCSVATRGEFGRLNRSPTLKPVDDRPVWSVVCLFVDRAHRRLGVAEELLRAAVDYAARRGARLVEGYPVDPSGRKFRSAHLYTGTVDLFRAAGFTEVARRSEARPIMRYRLDVGQP
ncbi:MAG: GNAT family N-acetyltransferase [Acidimicrobiia bacterium]